MTVIAWKAPKMGSDSRVADSEDGSISTNKAKKIFGLKNGGLIGLAGDADFRATVELFNRIKTKLPTAKQIVAINVDFDGLLVMPDRRTYYVGSGKKDKTEERFAQIIEFTEPFQAIGSGGKFALGALDRGATVEQAVLTAIKYDPSCGGTVQIYELETK